MKNRRHLRHDMWRNLFLVLSLWLGVCNGQLALWQENNSKPLAVFDIAVASLPESDQKALEYGIPVDSVEALFQRLEDFS